MGDEERHPYAVENAVEMDVLRDAHKSVDILAPPHPAHMLPVVRYRKIAFAFAAALLYLPPVVIGAPHHAAGEARLKRHRPRAVIAAQRDPFHADTPGIHLRVLFQPVNDPAGPVLAVIAGLHAVKTQRFAGSRLVDHQRGDPAPRQPLRQPHQIFHLFGGVETVDLHQQRRAAGRPFGADVKRRQGFALVGDSHPLTVGMGMVQPGGKDIEKAAVQRIAVRRAMRLQALAGQVIVGRPKIFLSCRQPPSTRLIFAGQRA